jgi:molybdate transport system regulatory protein
LIIKQQTAMKANGRIWIDSPNGAFLGYGRIELLEKTKALGSIRQAALEMKISYRQAWQFIQQMNQEAGEPLVISQRGGKGGGQATVTEKGLSAIRQFQEFNQRFQEFLISETSKLNF